MPPTYLLVWAFMIICGPIKFWKFVHVLFFHGNISGFFISWLKRVLNNIWSRVNKFLILHDTIFSQQPINIFLVLGWVKGWCIDREGKHLVLKDNNGMKKLGIKKSKGKCLTKCREVEDTTGCEFHPRRNRSGGKCLAHTQEVVSGSKKGSFQCFVFSD